MKQITKIFFHRVLIISILTLALISNAQVFNNGQGPVVQVPLACASDSFNTYNATVFFNEDEISSSNQFIIELSDLNGDFSNPDDVVEVSTPQQLTSSGSIIVFSLPEDAAGENYRIRVKSTDQEDVSSPSDEFPAYFITHDIPFSINDVPDTITFCPGTGVILEVDEINFFGGPSPRDFPDLTYNWFRQTQTALEEIAVDAGPSIEVNEEGTYFAVTNYGSCITSSESISNEINVILATTGGDPANATITSSLGNPFCSDGIGTTLSTNTGDSYEWFLDNQPIEGETGSTIQVTQSGDYAVIITTGSCVAVGSIQLENLGGTTTIDVPAVSFVEIGTPVIATVTTTLDNPQFEWFLNGQLIDGATENVFTATGIGTYSVVVTSTGECNSITELFFELSALVDVDNIPNTISPNGDGINDIWMIPAQYVSGTNTEVVILSSTGETILQTNDYANNWPESIDALGSGNQVFYYTISPQSEDMILGSITVVK